MQVATVPGAMISVTRMASFQSTLDDINAGFRLGLIDDVGIANSLSKKIQAARDATGPPKKLPHAIANVRMTENMPSNCV